MWSDVTVQFKRSSVAFIFTFSRIPVTSVTNCTRQQACVYVRLRARARLMWTWHRSQNLEMIQPDHRCFSCLYPCMHVCVCVCVWCKVNMASLQQCFDSEVISPEFSLWGTEHTSITLCSSASRPFILSASTVVSFYLSQLQCPSSHAHVSCPFFHLPLKPRPLFRSRGFRIIFPPSSFHHFLNHADSWGATVGGVRVKKKNNKKLGLKRPNLHHVFQNFSLWRELRPYSGKVRGLCTTVGPQTSVLSSHLKCLKIKCI